MTSTSIVSTSETPNAVIAINDYLAKTDAQATIGKLIKHSKGEFLKGQDCEPVPEGSAFVAACDLALRGFILWQDGKPAQHALTRIASGEPLPRREQLGNLDQDQWPLDSQGKRRDPWQPIMYLPLMSTDGELATFSNGSVSGIKSINRLLKRYATHAAHHPGDYPLVKLKVSFFMHSDRSIGKVFFPDFEPAGYVDRSEFCDALDAVGFDTDRVNKPLPKPDNPFDDIITF